MPSADQFMPDFKGWFSNTSPGTSLNWGGGTLTRTGSGAQYALPEWKGQENEFITFNENSDPINLARSYTGIMDTWNKQYGDGWQQAAMDYAHSYKPHSTSVGSNTWTDDDWQYATNKANLINSQGDNYTDYNPYNVASGQWTAQDVYNAFGKAGLTPQQHYEKYGKNEGLTWAKPKNPQMEMFGEDITGMGPSSYSGIGDKYSEEILSSLVPRLIESMENYRSDIDDSTQAATDLYSSKSRKALDSGLQTILDDLASRNIITDSDVAKDIISSGMASIAKDEGEKAMESKMLAASMKANEPSILNSIIGNTGKYSESNNTLAPIELLASFYQAMA